MSKYPAQLKYYHSEKGQQTWRDYYKQNQDPTKKIRHRVYKLKSLYKLSLARYLSILVQQGHRCALCRSSEWGGRSGSPNVDHDHQTGVVRGLLCFHCNHLLGKLGDNAQNVQRVFGRCLRYMAGS